MYQPKFNSVLVEIDDKAAAWGNGNDESMLGASYSKGKIIDLGFNIPTQQYPQQLDFSRNDWIGKDIMWNEGTEAGTTFEHDGKLYGFIYWWDIRGVKADA